MGCRKNPELNRFILKLPTWSNIQRELKMIFLFFISIAFIFTYTLDFSAMKILYYFLIAFYFVI